MASLPIQPPHGTPAWFHRMVEKSASGSIVTERVILTPALATEILRHNPDNRFIRSGKFTQICSDIRDGRWQFNGEPILISAEGLLNDGQHRCSAVVETNLPVETLVVFGLDRSSRTTVDQGAARCAGDYLSMDGVPNSTLVASVGRLLIAYESSSGKNFSASGLISAGEIIARFSHDPQVARAATFAAGTTAHAKKLAPPSLIALCHVLFSRSSAPDAETFLRQVCVGENIKRSDPAFAVREGLFRDRLTRDEKVHVIIRGWNAYRQRRALKLTKVIGNLPAVL